MCPRNALRAALRAARERHGVGFRVGFESEFVLLHDEQVAAPDGTLPKAVDRSLYCQASGFDASAAGAKTQSCAACRSCTSTVRCEESLIPRPLTARCTARRLGFSASAAGAEPQLQGI